VPVYADGHEKTEMLVALEPFCALVGWREAGAAAEVLAGCGLPADIVAAVRAEDRPAAVAALLGLDRAVSAVAVPGVADAALAAGLPAGAVGVLARIAAAYPDDPGVFVAVLLDHLDLEPGDAVYVPAGVPHAYVDGLGLEVMTSSDNVLRLGLTRKLVSVPDAVAAFRDDRRAQVVRSDPGAAVAPVGAPFTVALHRDGTAALPGGRYRVAVAIEGDVQLAVGHTVAVVAPGRAAVLPAGDPDARVTAAGLAAVVTEGGRS
jgi:mannose-6-phosphate isomerase